MELAEAAQAPVVQGAVLGEAVWLLDGVPVARVELVSAAGISRDVREPLTFWERLRGLFGGPADAFHARATLV